MNLPPPDLPVVKYSCLLKDVSIAKEASDNFGRYQNFRFVSTDGSTACFYHCSPECLRFDKPEENPITVFIAGDIGSVRILTEANTDITGRFEMKEKETVTLSKALRELLQKHFPEICETDSYNLFIKREWPDVIFWERNVLLDGEYNRLTTICGHTPYEDGPVWSHDGVVEKITDGPLPNHGLIDIDTGCFYSGILTALVLENGQMRFISTGGK